MMETDESGEKTEKILVVQISDVMFILDSMFVNHFGHKGPRLEARPWLMAAFYNFKAAVSDFIEPPRAVQGGPPV